MKHAQILTLSLRLVLLAYWITLTVGLLSPGGSEVLQLMSWLQRLLEEAVHLAAFAVLGFLAWLARPPGQGRWLAIALTVYGLATEIVQAFVPGRDCNLVDVLANLVGLALGVLAAQAMEAIGRWFVERKVDPPEPTQASP
jgi:hypothetical protein